MRKFQSEFCLCLNEAVLLLSKNGVLIMLNRNSCNKKCGATYIDLEIAYKQKPLSLNVCTYLYRTFCE